MTARHSNGRVTGNDAPGFMLTISDSYGLDDEMRQVFTSAALRSNALRSLVLDRRVDFDDDTLDVHPDNMTDNELCDALSDLLTAQAARAHARTTYDVLLDDVILCH